MQGAGGSVNDSKSPLSVTADWYLCTGGTEGVGLYLKHMNVRGLLKRIQRLEK